MKNIKKKLSEFFPGNNQPDVVDISILSIVACSISSSCTVQLFTARKKKKGSNNSNVWAVKS